MRTTVELTADQHRTLSALARQRGLRGFSLLVQEALDAYLRDLGAEELQSLLDLEGSLDDAEEREVRQRIEDARSMWRAS